MLQRWELVIRKTPRARADALIVTRGSDDELAPAGGNAPALDTAHDEGRSAEIFQLGHRPTFPAHS